MTASMATWGASDWQRIYGYLPALFDGALITLKVAFFALALGTALGLLVAMGSRSRFRPVRVVVSIYVQVGRGIPELVQIFIWYYVLPEFGIVLSPFLAGVIAIGVAFGPYLGEVFRAGVEAVDVTQWEAAEVLGLSRAKVWRRVVLPQALRTVFPVWTSYLISIFKATSLLSFISLREVFAVARNEAALNFRYLELFAIVMIIYLAMGVPTIVALRALARRWSTERVRTSPLPKNVDVPIRSVT